MSPTRRGTLRLAGAMGAAVVATAGTVAGATNAAVDDEQTNEGEQTNDDLPAYERWLTIDDGSLEFTYVDWRALRAEVEAELEEEAANDVEVPPEYDADPMIALPSNALLSTYLFVGLGLAPYGLGRLLEPEEFETTVEELIRANETFVASGSIARDELDERLTSEPEAGFVRRMERTDEIDGYDVYEPVEPDDDTAIAVGDDAIAVAIDDGDDAADDPLSRLQRTVGGATDDVERAAEESDTFAWLVESAGDGHVAVGRYGDPPNGEHEFEGLEDADGFVTSLTVVDEETLSGSFAAIIDDPDEEALEGLLGASADEQSVAVDDDRVVASAQWREEVIAAATRTRRPIESTG